MRKLVLGDIHGHYKALLQCFERSEFDYEKDQLIFLGDVADGWAYTYDCIEELLKVKNLIYVIGNHDIWLLDWFKTGRQPHIWTAQGGLATLKSYSIKTKQVLEKHTRFLEQTKLYHIDDENRIFVHGGFNPNIDIDYNEREVFYWDRELLHLANVFGGVDGYKEVYVGHTQTSDSMPNSYGNLVQLDTGAGYKGKLTIMEIETHEFWQSDTVTELYPNEVGR